MALQLVNTVSFYFVCLSVYETRAFLLFGVESAVSREVSANNREALYVYCMNTFKT